MAANPASLTRRWSDEKLRRELAFLDDNGGDPSAQRWIAAVNDEARRRGWVKPITSKRVDA